MTKDEQHASERVNVHVTVPLQRQLFAVPTTKAALAAQQENGDSTEEAREGIPIEGAEEIDAVVHAPDADDTDSESTSRPAHRAHAARKRK